MTERFHMAATRSSREGGAIIFNFELVTVLLAPDALFMRIAALDTMRVSREDAQRLRDWLDAWLK